MVHEHIRPKYGCEACQANVIIADKLPEPIDKGLPGLGLLAHIAVSNYGDHLPLYRLQGIFKRSGVEIFHARRCATGWLPSSPSCWSSIVKRMC